jgi:signal transduction histidine kinase
MLIVVQRGQDLRLEFFNSDAHKAVGGRDLTGKTLSQAFPELEQWLKRVSASARVGQAYVGVDEPVTLDWTGKGKRETRYLTLACQPLVSHGGAIDGAVTFAFDVTESVLVREQGPRDRAWMERALDAIGTPVLVAAPETRRIQYANAAARELSHGDLSSGGTFGGVIGLDNGFFCTDAAGARIPDDQLPVSRAARGEVVSAEDLLWHTPSGVIPLVCFAERVPASETLPAAIVLSFFDVSHVRRVERELADVTRTRDEFLDLVAHELRTPLTVIKLQVQSVLRQDPSAGGVAAIERATTRMEALVEQMLDAGRVRMGAVRLELAPVDLCEVVERVISHFRSEARRVSCSVTRVGDTNVRGIWDRARLEHVLGTLLSNALRFGPGAPVTIDCRDLGDRVSVTVSDRGVGIDRADHDRIFARYARAAPPRNFAGLGLGLWISQELVKQMGGSIAVASALGKGATFSVELPKSRELCTEPGCP